MNASAQVADHLDSRVDDVIAAWRAASVRNGNVPAATSLTHAEFVDHIPLLIDRMADRLRGRPADVAAAAEQHGHVRWRQGYDVAEVVAELGHLRSALVQATFAYARERHFDLPRVEAAVTAIDAVLNEAATESVRQFQSDSHAEARTAVAAREQLGAELAATAAQLQAIVEQSPVLIWRAGPNGGCNFFNRTWLEFRGRTAEQELGQGWVEGIHPDDRPRVLEARRSAPFEVTYRLLRRDGQYRWVSDHGHPLADAEGRPLGVLGSCLDITERIELEASLQQQRALAEESSRHKTRLMTALSHDARTPLNAVFLSAQLLELHVQPQADPEVAECLRTIRHSVRNVLDLLGDVLNLSKIDAGADPPEISRFELEPVLVECLASIEAQARQKGLDCRLEPGPLAGAVFQTDRAKLKQVLSNLLSNALKFTERGHIRLWAERANDQVRLAVEDTGVGIAPTDQSRVFDEFARLDHPQRPIGEGTGLGLAICRRLANLLGGEILLESAPGRGSTFTLHLPARRPPADEAVPRSGTG